LVSATYPVPSARYVALNPTGQYLLVFASNSDSVFLINLNATPVAPVEIPGFARPINAFFSSDGNTAYVLNCGPECGSANPASVAQFNLTNETITATLPVGGASVGLLNGTTLYVAGSPVPPGTTSTYDAVNVSNMTRLTANSVAIGDGFHTTMALANNSKLYIGANTCNNTTTGCLSVVDVTNNTADPPLPPRGAVTSLLAPAGRNVMYAVEGGFLHIYNTTTDTLQGTQLTFTGALFDIVQVDQ
jgi:DNA-binding beta-propeller fold protein YncE